eukprot:RCo034510
MYKVIITADDFGVNPYRDEGILRGFQEGLITHASVLVNGENPSSSARLAIQNGLLDRIGLHVNVTEGLPISPARSVPSLVDGNGRFLGREGFLEAAHTGRVSMPELKAEIKAQFGEFQKLLGKPATHVDGHMHVHVFSAVAEAFASAFAEAGARTVRIPFDVVLANSASAEDYGAAFQVSGPPRWSGPTRFLRIVQEAALARRTFFEAGLLSTDLFLGIGLMGQNNTVNKMQLLLRSGFLSTDIGHDYSSLKAKSQSLTTVEFMAHPGGAYPASARSAEFWHDDFSCNKDREHELQVLCDPSLVQEYRTSPDVSLVSWNAL